MEYNKIKQGIFIKRPNRFIAHVIIDGAEEIVHVKNTGRCKELLTPNAHVILEESDNKKRKTKYSLVAVYKGDMLINMDSQAPNAAAFEALSNGIIEEIGKVDFVKREVTYSKSRFDLYFEKGDKKGFIEVKGVTLEKNGIAAFPDAPTQRGARHLEELIKAKSEGYAAGILLLVQMKGPQVFMPNATTDPEFAEALRLAKIKGVEVMCYDCIVTENSMLVDKKIELDLVRSL